MRKTKYLMFLVLIVAGFSLTLALNSQPDKNSQAKNSVTFFQLNQQPAILS